MPNEAWRFHKEYAPKGRVFDLDKTPDAGLVAQGWVDSPAKIGVNVWGPQAEEAVAQKTADFEAGRIPAVDDGRVMSAEELNDLAKERRENEELRRQIEGLRQEESLAKQAAMSEEKTMDLRSDAAKIMGGGDGTAPPGGFRNADDLDKEVADAEAEMEDPTNI